MRVCQLIDAFIRNRELNNCDPATIQSYRDRAKPFEREFGKRKLKAVTLDDLLEHFHKSGAGLSDSTRRANIIIVERIHKFAIEREHLKKPWFRPRQIDKPKQGVREKFLTPGQTADLIDQLRPDSRLIYRTLRLTAARPGELCRAMIENLEGAEGARVIVLAKHKTVRKTGKPRRIVLTPAAEALVVQSIGEREEGPIFQNRHGKAWQRDRLSREFRRVRNLLGIDKRVVLYSARHEGATLIVQAVGIAHAKEQLGHSDIKTTQKYTHVPEGDIRAATASAIQDIKPREAA